MEVKMEFKKMFRSLLVIVFSLVMSNSVLGADTHEEFMKRHRMVLAGSQAALEQHRNQFPHLQEAANQAYDLHQRTVEDLTAQILLEKHGQGHIPTVVQIALARSQAHMKASQAFLIPSLGIKGNMADLFNDLSEGQATNQEDQAVDYSDLPPVEHAPEPIVNEAIDDQTQKYLKDLAEAYNEENVPHNNETLKEFVRKHVIDSTVGVNGKGQELYRFYQTEVKQMQKEGVDPKFIEQFEQDIHALFNEIGTYQVVPGMALLQTPAAPAQDVSRSSSAASQVPMSDEDGKDSPVVFDRNRGGSSPSSSTELDTPDSQRYFSPISREPQESPVASPVQGVSRSSSVASQSEQPDSDEGSYMPSSDSEGDDSDDEDDEEPDFAAKKIVASIPKNFVTEQHQKIFVNNVYEEFLKRPEYFEVKKEITKARQDALDLINKKFRKQQ